MNTATATAKKASSTTTAPTTKKLTSRYDQRTGVGDVVASHRPENLMAVDGMEEGIEQPVTIDTTSFTSNLQEPYRLLFTPLEQRASWLEEQLVAKEEQFKSLLENETVDCVGVARQEAVWCIGRICNAVCIYETWEFFLCRASILTVSFSHTGPRRTSTRNHHSLGRFARHFGWSSDGARCLFHG